MIYNDRNDIVQDTNDLHFNPDIKLTKRWKEVILTAIDNRRENYSALCHDCMACQYSREFDHTNSINSSKCPLDHLRREKSWCYGYGDVEYNDEQQRLDWLDEMERRLLED